MIYSICAVYCDKGKQNKILNVGENTYLLNILILQQSFHLWILGPEKMKRSWHFQLFSSDYFRTLWVAITETNQDLVHE